MGVASPKLEALAATAGKQGWAAGSGDVESVRKQAAQLGWVEVAPRRGDPAVSVLRPSGPEAAHPSSLSAVYGLGQQPLHTERCPRAGAARRPGVHFRAPDRDPDATVAARFPRPAARAALYVRGCPGPWDVSRPQRPRQLLRASAVRVVLPV